MKRNLVKTKAKNQKKSRREFFRDLKRAGEKGRGSLSHSFKNLGVLLNTGKKNKDRDCARVDNHEIWVLTPGGEEERVAQQSPRRNLNREGLNTFVSKLLCGGRVRGGTLW